MTIADKWLDKSITSFSSENFYQGIKQFNNSILRSIESNDLSKIDDFFDIIIPILHKNQLIHESDQIITFILKSLKKHKIISVGFIRIFNKLISVIENNVYADFKLNILSILLKDLISNKNPESIAFLKNNYNQLLINAVNYQFLEETQFSLFRTFVFLKMFPIALEIAIPTFIDSIQTSIQLKFGMYSILVLAIQDDLKKSLEVLQNFRKTVAKDLQKLEIFQCSSEFILASSSKDLDWFSELKIHFSKLLLKDSILSGLIIKLTEKYFPSKKSSIFDLFSQK